MICLEEISMNNKSLSSARSWPRTGRHTARERHSVAGMHQGQRESRKEQPDSAHPNSAGAVRDSMTWEVTLELFLGGRAQPKGWHIWGTAASSWAATWEDLLGKQLVMLEKLVEFWPRRTLSAELRSVASFHCRGTLPGLQGSHTGQALQSSQFGT